MIRASKCDNWQGRLAPILGQNIPERAIFQNKSSDDWKSLGGQAFFRVDVPKSNHGCASNSYLLKH
jgi:hypothetical protein